MLGDEPAVAHGDRVADDQDARQSGIFDDRPLHGIPLAGDVAHHLCAAIIAGREQRLVVDFQVVQLIRLRHGLSLAFVREQLTAPAFAADGQRHLARLDFTGQRQQKAVPINRGRPVLDDNRIFVESCAVETPALAVPIAVDLDAHDVSDASIHVPAGRKIIETEAGMSGFVPVGNNAERTLHARQRLEVGGASQLELDRVIVLLPKRCRRDGKRVLAVELHNAVDKFDFSLGRSRVNRIFPKLPCWLDLLRFRMGRNGEC